MLILFDPVQNHPCVFEVFDCPPETLPHDEHTDRCTPLARRAFVTGTREEIHRVVDRVFGCGGPEHCWFLTGRLRAVEWPDRLPPLGCDASWDGETVTPLKMKVVLDGFRRRATDETPPATEEPPVSCVNHPAEKAVGDSEFCSDCWEQIEDE